MFISSVKARIASLFFTGVLVLSGVSCERIGKAAEERDPNVKRARALRAVGDFAGAIESYDKALLKRPKSARIHWEMASIYDLELTNDLRAIYHYERYLELDPKADRRPYAEQLIAAAKLQYAISLPDRFSTAVDENARLRKENDALKALLTEARDEVARLSGKAAPAATAPATPSPRPAPPVPAPEVAQTRRPEPAGFESYTVQPGDTLSRIALRFYNDSSKWDVIFEANKATLKQPGSVRVGQTLVIPR